MKKHTKRYTEELGKTRRQQKREERQKEKKKQGANRRSSGNGLKKNIRHKLPIEFQVTSRHSLKFCKRVPLTQELRKLLGRGIIKIVPKEIREHPEMLPYISVYRDTKNNKLILSIDSVEHQDNFVTDQNGDTEFQPDIEFATKRFKHPINHTAED